MHPPWSTNSFLKPWKHTGFTFRCISSLILQCFKYAVSQKHYLSLEHSVLYCNYTWLLGMGLDWNTGSLKLGALPCDSRPVVQVTHLFSEVLPWQWQPSPRCLETVMKFQMLSLSSRGRARASELIFVTKESGQTLRASQICTDFKLMWLSELSANSIVAVLW